MKRKNGSKIGLRYGQLTVIERSKRKGTNGQYYHVCRCDCGNTREILLRNSYKSCGCLQRKRFLKSDAQKKIGKKYGKLEVIEELPRLPCLPLSKEKHRKDYLCRCDCGNVVIRKGKSLNHEKYSSCGCASVTGPAYKKADIIADLFAVLEVDSYQNRTECVYTLRDLRDGNVFALQKRYIREDLSLKDLLRRLYRKYKVNAKRRGIPFKIKIEEFASLISQPCDYCGLGYYFNYIYKNGLLKYNGIDRRDNDGDYVLANVTPCCKICNFAKGTTKEKEFREWLCSLKGG